MTKGKTIVQIQNDHINIKISKKNKIRYEMIYNIIYALYMYLKKKLIRFYKLLISISSNANIRKNLDWKDYYFGC